MMETFANVGPMFSGVLHVVQHWPTLPPPFTALGQTLVNVLGGLLPVVQHWPTLPSLFTTLGQTLANVGMANVGQCWAQYLATFLEKQSLGIIMGCGSQDLVARM